MKRHFPLRSRLAWFWAMPNISIALFVLAVGAFLFFYHHHERDQRRLILIEDLLWQEQTIRQQLQNHEEALAFLAHDMVQQSPSDAKLKHRAAFLLRTNPEIIDVYWLDEHRRIQWRMADKPQADDATLTEEAFQRSKLMGRVSYTPVHSDPRADSWFELHAPLAKDTAFHGTLVARISLQRLLKHWVPWWYAERYQLSIVDGEGKVLAAKLNVPIVDKELVYELEFDPPGHGLVLRANDYRTSDKSTPQRLEAVIIALSVLIVWSLWALRQHIRRRELAEAALREEYAFRTSMENSMATGMRAVDAKGRIIYVNPAFCNMLGWSEEELMGHAPPMPYWPQDSENEAQKAYDAMLRGEAPPEGAERNMVTKDGRTIDVLIQSAPLIDAKGRMKGWMSSVTDITERKRADALARQQEEKLQFTARLVTMGEMASSLAHELNQPLSAISSFTAGCLNKAESGASGGELRPALEIISNQAKRAGKIIKNIREFVKKSEPRRRPTDLAEVLEEAVSLADIEARRQGIRLRLHTAPGLPPVSIDRVMIEQVIFNLVKNGMEAMEGQPPERQELRVEAAPYGEGKIQVCIEDSGAGISDEAAAQLYTPFFTTKTEGMGMGLNICRSIIEFHQGRLWHEPREDGGTRFCFTLPAEA